MYVQVPAFIDFLHSWRCRHSHMFDCMLQLGYEMAQHDYWSPQDLQLLTAWVSDLSALGYEPPALLPRAAGAKGAAAESPAAVQVSCLAALPRQATGCTGQHCILIIAPALLVHRSNGRR